MFANKYKRLVDRDISSSLDKFLLDFYVNLYIKTGKFNHPNYIGGWLIGKIPR